MKSRLLLILFLLFWCWASLWAEIKVIPEREYFGLMHDELIKAQESIDITMYLMKLGDNTPQVKALLEDLKLAQKRGLRVKVLLDDQRENEEAYQYLKENISIQIDSPEIKTHTKKILIDGKRLIIGSSNWSEAAFGKNHEANIVLDLEEDKDKILLLEGKNYFNELMGVLKNCRKSLDIAMYLFLFERDKADDPVYKIVNELLRLHRQGVEIRVILDSWEEEPWGQNDAIKFLLGLEGVTVYYDRGEVATHTKLVVVDAESVLLGSANWTRAALEKNIESSVFIKSKDITRQFSSYFNSLLADIPEINSKDQYFRLPLYFIKEDGPVRWLAGRGSEYSLRLYLWFIWQAFKDKSPEIPIHREEWYDIVCSEKSLSQPEKYKRAYIDDCLELLGNRRLLRREMDKVVLLNPGWLNSLWSFPEEDYFIVPGKLMEYGWFKKISGRALYGYLVNLAEFRSSSCKPYWFDSSRRLEKRYGLSQKKILRAFRELMAFNLIEIIHDIPDPGQPFWKRKANRYLLNDLLSETERAIRWQVLKERHGELFHKARSLAARINDPEDPQIVGSLIMLMKIYGEEAVSEVIDKIVSRYSVESGRWEMRYIIGILQHDYTPLE